MNPEAEAIRATVREKYASIARGEPQSCCGAGQTNVDMIGDAYRGVEGYVDSADLKLGCGVPVEHAGLAAGQTVLDLGSGAGLDAFVARRIVGPEGRVLGVDFTPEMVRKARENARTLGYGNVEFEHGDIERLPLEDASVDVIISNCVLNLVANKDRAFAEMARVLRPGGHFCVSDIVSRGELPEPIRASAALYAGCVAGVIDLDDYRQRLMAAGFSEIEVVAARRVGVPEPLMPTLTDDELAQYEAAGLTSVTLRGRRPGTDAAMDDLGPFALPLVAESPEGGCCGR